MNPERHERIGVLFLAARELSPADRPGFFDEQCGDDAALRGEVESLLASDERGPDLEQVPGLDVRAGMADLGERLAEAAEAAGLPEEIGQYRVIRRLGAGGMGAVYLAEQSRPRRRVAVKVIRAGASSPRLVRRFLNEAQVLGQLQHPGIAQIHEAGMYDDGSGGQPFFAMEYVDGAPLDEHLESADMALRDRLELLARICDAVHHAHQKGVIHRDLKPGNILIDASGQPRILDFGVARVTDADVQVTTLHTDVGQLLGTIPYMSPEQVAGDSTQLDRRSDVYALGVICYQALAGRLPHDLRNVSIPEAARVIREDEPSRLSSISTTYRGDVETIVAKALEKDKQRRYASAAALAADLRRYLADEPIVARPQGTVYQLSKFARRHKALVGGMVATVLALVVGLVGISWFAIGARREAERASAVNAFLLRMLEEANPELNPGGRQMTVPEMLDRAAALIERSFSDQPRSEAAVRLVIGRAYTVLGQYAPAIVNLDRAVEINRDLGDDEALAEALVRLSAARSDDGQYEQAEAEAREAIEIGSRRLGHEHPQLVRAWATLGGILTHTGDTDEAKAYLERTIDVGGRVLEAGDPALARTRGDLGALLFYEGAYERAEQLFREAAAMQREALGADHPDYAKSLINLGVLLRNAGDLGGAEAAYREATPIVETVFGPDHELAAVLLNNLARIEQERGELDAARAMFVEVVDRRRRLLGDDHPDVNLARRNVGSLDVARGDHVRAEETLRAALAFDRDRFGTDHTYTRSSMIELAAALGGQGRHADAEPLYGEVVESLRRTRPAGHPSIGWNLVRLGSCLVRQERLEEGERTLLEAHAIFEAAGHADAHQWNRCVESLAELYEAGGKPGEAMKWRRLVRGDGTS